MVYDSSQLDSLFHALSDPTRRAMLGQLAEGDCTIGALANPHHMSLVGASKHIRVLERAGLVARTVHGRNHICSLRAQHLAAANAWLKHYEKFWTDRLDTLEGLLRAELPSQPPKDSKDAP
jgi:DNA-binding transcriptional ArsR family regulator